MYELEIRRRPVQARSAKTFDHILDTAIVVLEDVDLIARHRESMRSPTEEVMLNKLLNEMDGTRQDAELIFILTTNRPSVLEEALTARPGRIDQAIESNIRGSLRMMKLAKETKNL